MLRGKRQVAYLFAAVIYLFADLRHRIIWTAGILLGYYAALRFIQQKVVVLYTAGGDLVLKVMPNEWFGR